MAGVTTALSSSDEALTRRIRSSFERQGLMRLLGARLDRVEPWRVQITLPRRAEVSPQHGYVHAGATSAIADGAGGYSALNLMPETSEVLTTRSPSSAAVTLGRASTGWTYVG